MSINVTVNGTTYLVPDFLVVAFCQRMQGRAA
jgi:hypothetical protein